MSDLGTYSFLPWLRRGIANQITALDGAAGAKLRASVTVTLSAGGTGLDGAAVTPIDVPRDVALYGPGDILGLERRAVFRLEPREGTTNFEPNHLVHLEFYDEDMPWRYTPAAPGGADGGRLRPWLALIVLADDEFKEGADPRGRPLPYIDVVDTSGFPRADEAWAWAHVHVNRDLDAAHVRTTDMAAVIPRLRTTLAGNADLGFGRLVSPRKLRPDQGYTAFLMPTFEAGRRAGLGLDLDDIPATASAWEMAGRPQPLSFPYYLRWRFRTGEAGDFETLVELLKPRQVDPRVGFRDMDVQAPGSNVAPLDRPELGGILRLGGALQPPGLPPDIHETWDTPYPRPFQDTLATFINKPDDYRRAADPDPIISPPLYGRWPAMIDRVLKEYDGAPSAHRTNWIHRLNLDPRFRAAAGIGTRVIQDGQERYMEAAWNQVGDVLEASRRFRFAQFGLLTTQVWFDRHLVATAQGSTQQAMMLTAPLAKRVTLDGATIHHALRESRVQPAMTSSALRRIMRPRARLVRSLPFDATRKPDELMARVNDGAVSAAPPKVAPAGAVTADGVAAIARPAGAPAWVADALARWPRLPDIVPFVAMLLALVALLLLPWVIGVPVAVLIVTAGIYLRNLLKRWARALTAAAAVSLDQQTPAAIDALPPVPGFVVGEPGSVQPWPPGSSDSVEATRFKAALQDTLSLVAGGAAIGKPPARASLDLPRLVDQTLDALAPARTISRRFAGQVQIPPRIRDGMTALPAEILVEPMAYPVIDEPMYQPLKTLGKDYFVPHLDLIEPNSITLLETNQRFIESYMVGVNHEFARELLWREYPTDQRGTPFRQFWDVRSVYNANALPPDDFRESLRDIPPIHLWRSTDALGDHDNREQGRDNEEELVLVVRGELLKRYPNAVIYAHRACWQRKIVTQADKTLPPCQRSGAIDNTVERRRVGLTAAEEANPPPAKVLTPLYEAKVDPDIYFFGFDLTVEQARGGTGAAPGDDPGWFFVIKERPGEPRFGLDDAGPATIRCWNDFSWPIAKPDAERFLSLATAPATLTVADPGPNDERYPQYLEDVAVAWNRTTMTAADMAYILYQAPVLVAYHASEMLPK